MPAIVLAALVLLVLPWPAAAQQIPGQKPWIVVAERFQFTPGAWASYEVTDKVAREVYRLYVATLEREKKQRRPASWMEIGVESADNPAVVTRLLAEETVEGPGKLLKVIVQVAGYAPFTVPKKYFEGEHAQVSPARTVEIARTLERRTVAVGSREIDAWEVEARDTSGAALHAVVSERVLPIGVVEAESDAMRMVLLDWGTDARTKISGAPRPFTLWILEHIANEMGKAPAP